MAYDLNWGSVSLAMHMTDAALSDLKGKTISLSGNVARSSVTAPAFASFSAAFDGTGDYLSTTSSLSDFVFGTGDFTLELWVKTSTTGKMLLDFYASGYNGWQLLVSGGFLQFYVTTAVKTGAVSVTTGAWVHIAVVRSSGNLMFFINGTQDGTPTAFSTNLSNKTSAFGIGAQVASRNASYDFNGYMSDVRITKGVALYTSNFTVPNAAFLGGPSISGTVRDASNAPVAATVRAYRRDTGELAAATVSDGGTGGYSLTTQDASLHTVVRLVSTADNAQIFDNVTPG